MMMMMIKHSFLLYTLVFIINLNYCYLLQHNNNIYLTKYIIFKNQHTQNTNIIYWKQK